MEFTVVETESDMVGLRYGFLSGNAKTLKEVGEHWGHTDEFIRGVIRSVQRRVKHKNNVLRVIDRLKLTNLV